MYDVPMTRVLILCTHNSARSQMGEALIRAAAQQANLNIDIHSAGTEATFVKEPAKTVISELGLSLEHHTSKTLEDLPDKRNFDYVITVCDSAAESCPIYPEKTEKRHYPFIDPSGGSLARWRAVRDQMKLELDNFILALKEKKAPRASYSKAPEVTVE